MSQLPPAGTSPKEFFEVHVPRAYAAATLPESARQLDLTLGVKLEGEGGGEWRIHLKDGAMKVEPGSVEDAAFTVIQSVDDWRGALWEGRGGAFGKQSRALFEPGAGSGAGALPPSALAQLQMLRGVIKMVVGGGPGGDWAVAFKLGPGPIPEQPTTTVTVSADDAAALERGELDPMQAFMSGRIQIAGDMTLLMQMQAIQMQAQAMASSPGKA